MSKIIIFIISISFFSFYLSHAQIIRIEKVRYNIDSTKIFVENYLGQEKDGNYYEIKTNDSKDTIVKGYFKNGKKHDHWIYKRNKDSIVEKYDLGLKNGDYRFYDSNKVLRVRYLYKDDTISSLSLTYHPNSQVRLMYGNKHGCASGRYTCYFENGQIECSGNYEVKKDSNLKFHSIPIGEWKYYHKNGNLALLGCFDTNRINVEFERTKYDNDEITIYQVEDSMIRPIGLWKFFDNKGNISYVKDYTSIVEYVCDPLFMLKLRDLYFQIVGDTPRSYR